MSGLRRRAGLVAGCLALAGMATGCGHTGAAAGPGPMSIDCKAIKHRVDVALTMDATSKKSLEESLPKTHDIEVCKGKQSVLWFAERGESLTVTFDPPKPGNGRLKTPIECFDVRSANNDPVASFCLQKTTSADDDGDVHYKVVVKTLKDGEVTIDPRLIIKE